MQFCKMMSNILQLINVWQILNRSIEKCDHTKKGFSVYLAVDVERPLLVKNLNNREATRPTKRQPECISW